MDEKKLDIILKFVKTDVKEKDCKIVIFVNSFGETSFLSGNEDHLPNALANVMERSKVLKDLLYDLYSYDVEVNLKIDDLFNDNKR